ncbi:MFS-type transporter clz9-like [Aphidius gifuensis]|uniref:MFS-type transporter clz9-like n=1 Tax=Aphidius gifuensis TaxID=684658 RepID=UPI001CDBAFA9|nr:MFS-type transporter clz9-like [Aphidius gifuensis]
MGKTKPVNKYTEDDLQEALAKLKDGQSLGSVARQYKIPKSTLSSKHRGLSKQTIQRRGPQCVLGDENEKQLVNWILQMSEHGFPITKSQLINSVQLLFKVSKKSSPFINNRPGRHWMTSFFNRHSEICKKMSENLLYTRANLTGTILREWFEKIKYLLEKKNLINIDSSRIYTCDEFAFSLRPREDKIIVRRQKEKNYSFVSNDEKEYVSTLFCGNAAGQFLPPAVTFKYARLIPRSISITMPREWVARRTDSGWQTGESFYGWMTKCFEPWLRKNNIQFPVILYIDGHACNMTFELTKFCQKKSIVLIALHPNASHIMKPLDIAFFNPMKDIWKNIVQEWQTENNGESLKRELYSSLLKEAIENWSKDANLSDGFRSAGLHPFSVDVIEFEKSFQNNNNNNNNEQDEQVIQPVHVFQVESNDLEMIESYIQKDILKSFKNFPDDKDWTEPIEYKELFNVWKKIKNNSNYLNESEKTSSDDESSHEQDERPTEIDFF